jgi:hypothetical protein
MAVRGDLFHPGADPLVLPVVLVLNVCQPRGVTPRGWREQQGERKARRRGTGVGVTNESAVQPSSGR